MERRHIVVQRETQTKSAEKAEEEESLGFFRLQINICVSIIVRKRCVTASTQIYAVR